MPILYVAAILVGVGVGVLVVADRPNRRSGAAGTPVLPLLLHSLSKGNLSVRPTATVLINL
jgi:hypothetical protein